MQVNATAVGTFPKSGALAPYLRVVMSGGNLALAGAAEVEVGTTKQRSLASGLGLSDVAAVVFANAQGTVKMIADGAVTQYARVYGAASGKVSATVNSNLIGIALDAATADGDEIEVLRLPHGEDSLLDDEPLGFGTGDDVHLLWSTGDADNHTLVIGLGDSNQSLHITDKGAKATDWNVAANTHPTVYVHSNTTPATDYLRIGDHDGTEADIDLVGGTSLALKIGGTEYASLRTTGLAVGTYVAASTPGTDQVTIKSTGTAPSGAGANVGHIYCDFETDDDELFYLSGTVGTATQLTT